MTFLAPYFLAGLGGLIVPLLIHLWSNRKPEVIPFGSLRFIPSSEPRKTMSVLLTDKWLLFLRMLFLTLLILILARPAKIEPDPAAVHWILIDPLLADNEKVRMLIDSTSDEVHLMTAGFPSPDHSPAAPARQNLWALAEKASRFTDSLTIITTDLQRNFSGRRPALKVPVNWMTLGLDSAGSPDPVLEYQGKSGLKHTIIAHPAETALRLEHRKESGTALPLDTLRIQVFAVENDTQIPQVQAAVSAISDYLDIPIEISRREMGHPGADLTIDLTGQLSPDSGKWLLSVPEQPGDFILATSDPDVYLLNGDVTPERIYAENFAAALLRLLDPFRADELQERMSMRDIRPMESPIVSGSEVKEDREAETTPIVTWPLWLLAAIVFFAERIISNRKHA